MSVFISSVFKSTVYKTNTPANDGIGSGPAHKSYDPHNFYGNRKKLEEDLQKINQVSEEFSENRYSEIYEKAAAFELREIAKSNELIAPLIEPAIQKNFITYEQLIELRNEIAIETHNLSILRDDDDFLLILSII